MRFGPHAQIGLVAFFACRLSGSLLFHRKAAGQREAVEGLVYLAVLNLIAERRYPLLLISRVHLNRYRQAGYVQQQASACAACSTVSPWTRRRGSRAWPGLCLVVCRPAEQR